MAISSRSQQLLRPGIEHETLQPTRFVTRRALTPPRQPEVAPAWVVYPAWRGNLLDQPLGK
jgi:hypothetical protein